MRKQQFCITIYAVASTRNPLIAVAVSAPIQTAFFSIILQFPSIPRGGPFRGSAVDSSAELKPSWRWGTASVWHELRGNEELQFSGCAGSRRRFYIYFPECAVARQSTEEICSSATNGPFGIQLSDGNPTNASPSPLDISCRLCVHGFSFLFKIQW